jgi:hypothetical protein
MTHRWILPILAMAAIAAVSQTDPWAAMRVFEGKWEGPTSEKPGKGTTNRECQFEVYTVAHLKRAKCPPGGSSSVPSSLLAPPGFLL